MISCMLQYSSIKHWRHARSRSKCVTLLKWEFSWFFSWSKNVTEAKYTDTTITSHWSRYELWNKTGAGSSSWTLPPSHTWKNKWRSLIFIYIQFDQNTFKVTSSDLKHHISSCLDLNITFWSFTLPPSGGMFDSKWPSTHPEVQIDIAQRFYRSKHWPG